MVVALLKSPFISAGFGSLASATAVPKPPTESGEKLEEPAEDSSSIVSAALTTPVEASPSQNKRLGGAPVILFISADGLTAAFAAFYLQKTVEWAHESKTPTSLTHDSIRFGSLQQAWSAGSDNSNLFINHAKFYLDKDLKTLKIPSVATDAEIAAEGIRNPHALVSINSASLVIAMDKQSRRNILEKFKNENVDPVTIRGYLIQRYASHQNIALERHPENIEDSAFAFLKVPYDLKFLYDIREAVRIFVIQTGLITAS